MQKKLEYILNKRLTTLGKSLGAEDFKTVEQFFGYLNHVSIVFRCLGADYLQKQYNTSKDNIGLLSEYIFLYGDKGKLFYDELDQKTRNLDTDELTRITFSYIYDKFQKVFISQRLKSPRTIEAIERFNHSEPNFISYWEHISENEWLSQIEKLDERDRQQVKDYYVAVLHTVGLAGYGRNSYFLSTSRRKDIGTILNIPRDGIEIIGWVKLGRNNVYTFDRIEKKAQYVKKLGFPISKTLLYPEQKEITYKCGLLPHFIIGFFYEDAFEVNPYIFKSNNFINVSREGLPICQAPFYERLKEVNYRSTYIEYDDMFFQIPNMLL